jgi:hypothetical protein
MAGNPLENFQKNFSGFPFPLPLKEKTDDLAVILEA